MARSLAAVLALLLAAPAAAAPKVVVGSKAFPESWILGEALATLARQAGAEVEHKQNLGGTEVVYEALRAGAIDVYAEYTGTISEVILQTPDHPDLPALRAALAEQGIGVSDPLGFNDGYALALSAAAAKRYGI